MGNRRNSNHFSRRVALGGVFTALSLVMLLVGGIIPLGTYAAPIFSGICLLPVCYELGTRTSLLCYIAVALLGGIMVPDLEVVLFFALLFGYYPILQPIIGRIKIKALRVVTKLALFNAAVVAIYLLLVFVVASPAIIQEFSEWAWWFWAGTLALGNLLFWIYDLLLGFVKIIYYGRIRRHLFR